jgi:hypothetical protein
VFYDVHVLPPSAQDDPRGALVRLAADQLAARGGRPSQAPTAPVVDPAVVEQLRARWVRPGEGLRIVDEAGVVTVRLPYWYVGKQAKEQAKVLHAVVRDLEKAGAGRAFDPQLDDWFTDRHPRDTAAVLDAVADFEARERVDSPAVDARRAARAEAAAPPRLGFRRRRT